MLYSGTLTLVFQGQTFSCNAFDIKEIAYAADVPGRFVWTRTAPVLFLFFYSNLVSWPLIFFAYRIILGFSRVEIVLDFYM